MFVSDFVAWLTVTAHADPFGFMELALVALFLGAAVLTMLDGRPS